MNTLFINLSGVNTLTPGRRVVYTIIGILILFMSMTLLLNAAFEKNYHISLLSPAINFAVGLYFALTGLGLIDRKAKQYIRIDNKQIEYKPSLFRFPEIIKLDKITGFKIEKSLITCITADKTFVLNLKRASGSDLKQLKETIRKVAANRTIEVTQS